MRRQDFLTGFCAEYAIALHNATGWPLYVVKGYGGGDDDDDDDDEEYEVAHAFASPDRGMTAVDASGRSSAEDVAARCVFSLRGGARPRVVVERVSVDDLEAEMPVDADALAEARKLVELDFARRHR